MTTSEATTAPTVTDRAADARAWLGEFFGHYDGGGIRLATLSPSDGWQEMTRGVRHDSGPFLGKGASREDMLTALADALVREAESVDVFACPYAHHGPRREGGGVARRHAHADIDGPLDLDLVRAVGGIAVASGSLSADGRPRGHVYVRLSCSVSAEVHAALCGALGQYVGGEHHDDSKDSDEDVLRPAGTVNHKRGSRAVVRWLITPDDDGVKTWEPDALADVLGLSWPLAVVEMPAPDPVVPEQEQAAGALTARLDGLARSVTDAPRGSGNGRLNWAAGVAAAICATEGDGLDLKQVKEDLVAAYMGRPIPSGDSPRARRAEAERTVRSGWRWGTTNPTRALTGRPDEIATDTDLTETDESVPMTTTTTDDEQAVRTWREIDLAPYLDGSWTAPEPTVGRRTDGAALFYRGRTHSVASETEAGKTWLALAACADEMRAGEHVLYLDMEDDAGGAAGRLLALALDPAMIGSHFHYVRPEGPLTEDEWREFGGLLTELSPSLVVLDGMTNAMSLHALNPLDNREVSDFDRRVIRRLVTGGGGGDDGQRPAVVLLDHVTKSREGRGRYQIGAVHKLNSLNGAAYVLKGREPIRPGAVGRSSVLIAKDRPGRVKVHAVGKPDGDGLLPFADLMVTSEGSEMGSPVTVEVAAAAVRDEPTAEEDREVAKVARLSLLKANITEVLARHPQGLSGAKIGSALRAKGRGARNDDVSDALFALQHPDEGEGSAYVTGTPHRLLRRYYVVTGEES